MLLKTLSAAALVAMSLVAPAAAQTTTLDFPSWQAEEPGLSNWWKELIKDFEAQNPNVKINLYSIPFNQYVQQMTVRFAGNNPPDIVHLPTRNFAAFAAQDWLMPLDDRLAKTDILATWTPLQSEMKWDGKMQGVLLMGYGSLLYYNERLMKAAGVDVPTTPDQWLTAIEKTTKRDQGQFGLVATSVEHPNLVVELGTWVMGRDSTSSRTANTPSRIRRSLLPSSSIASRCASRRQEPTRPWRASCSSTARPRSCATDRGSGRPSSRRRRQPAPTCAWRACRSRP